MASRDRRAAKCYFWKQNIGPDILHRDGLWNGQHLWANGPTGYLNYRPSRLAAATMPGPPNGLGMGAYNPY